MQRREAMGRVERTRVASMIVGCERTVISVDYARNNRFKFCTSKVGVSQFEMVHFHAEIKLAIKRRRIATIITAMKVS